MGGRLAAGAASDWVETRLGQPRSVFLVFGAILMGMSLAVLSVSPGGDTGAEARTVGALDPSTGWATPGYSPRQERPCWC